jgi:hypothetical protein
MQCLGVVYNYDTGIIMQLSCEVLVSSKFVLQQDLMFVRTEDSCLVLKFNACALYDFQCVTANRKELILLAHN